jgi:hypothetical protein
VFFNEMTAGFSSAGRALFSELSVNGRVIASTSNYSSGRAGFAFKLGWDPEFAKYSPGLLKELELIRAAPSLWTHHDFLDSGAAPDSFMGNIWLARRTLVSGMLTWNALGNLQLATGQIVRGIRDTLLGRSRYGKKN